MINILLHIVDDDRETAEEIETLLTDSGETGCVIHTDPEEFLKIEQVVHMCVSDFRYKNSGLTGLDIVEELMKRNKRCKIIVITVAFDERKIFKLLNVGAWKYLDKTDKDFNNDLIKYVKQGLELIREDVEIIEELNNSRREKRIL